MINQIKSEWIKVRSVRSTIVMFILAVVFSALFASLGQIGSDVDPPLENAFIGILISQVFFLVLGIQIIGQEYRFKTIRPTFTATPKRLRVIYAKLIVLVCTVSVTTFVLMIIAILCAQLTLQVQNLSLDLGSSDTLQILVATFASSVLYAVFGFGIGAILKNPIAAIVMSIIYLLVVESILVGISTLLEWDYYKWLPFQALSGMIDFGEGTNELLSPLPAFIYVCALFGLIVATGSILINKRDA